MGLGPTKALNPPSGDHPLPIKGPLWHTVQGTLISEYSLTVESSHRLIRTPLSDLSVGVTTPDNLRRSSDRFLVLQVISLYRHFITRNIWRRLWEQKSDFADQ